VLYVTTRDSNDPQTAYKTLHNNVASDGGCYIPFRLESFTPEYLAALKDKSFGQAIADILNYFFSVSISGWDVDFCIGRNACKFFNLSAKIALVKTWFNPGSSYDYIVDTLYSYLCKDAAAQKTPTKWVRIAVRIAVIFGVFGQIMRQNMVKESQAFDLAISVDNINDLIAAWYAKCLGLPIGRIICGCSNSQIWDLLHRGELNTNQLSEEQSMDLEFLLYSIFGQDEASAFLKCWEGRNAYVLESWLLDRMRKELFATVVSAPRVSTVINSVYRTDAVIIDPKTAIAYGALQDFRAKTGANNATVLLSDETPMKKCQQVVKATGITEQALAQLCDCR